MKNKITKQSRRALRTRKKITAVGSRLRLTVFRSNKYLYAQIIDDKKAQTLVSIGSKVENEDSAKKMEASRNAGKLIAKKAKKKKIKTVVFDKGPYKFHGRVKAFAEGAREEGLIF